MQDYSKALELATQAALAGGDVLREEFHRPGGPRGPIGKAVSDEEAEHVIRGRLLAAGFRQVECVRDAFPPPYERALLVSARK